MTTCTTGNSISQLSGELNLEMIDDNDLTFSINWHMDFTDYSFEANIIPKNGEAEIPMTVEVMNVTEGIINVTITSASILELLPSTHKWYLNWTIGGLVRTVLSGALIIHPR